LIAVTAVILTIIRHRVESYDISKLYGLIGVA
jgi:hypothetical protein